MVVGLLLIVLELVFLPGAIVGIAGGIMVIAGIVKAYAELGMVGGNIFLTLSLLVFGITAYFCMKFRVWSKFSLHDRLEAKVNEGILTGLQVGDVGKTITALRPGGRAEFNHVIYEVFSTGGYCEEGKTVKIINIENSKVIVEPVN